ncbi:type IV secretion system protein [Caulobacter sp. DWR2-3-1b2]|uniref:type IV secretion system protein n=1 Tax=unclassified Caulobacter TaxID=2648921 RepID=UPI003CE6F60E
MAGACPVPKADDPLVTSLLQVVDCNVRGLVESSYGALFAPTGGLGGLLTALLTIFVALFGYQLLLGRAQLRISDLAMTMIKLGAVLALTTQWSTYQTVVYAFLFDGPRAIANAMLGGGDAQGAAPQVDVFARLQQTFDLLQVYAAEYAKQAPGTASPLIGGAGFGAFGLTAASAILLLSSLGVLLAAKIVLGLLLALGPIFIALLLFDTTRGVFEGWLRASLAFAFAPLAIVLLLGVALTLIEPSLLQLAEVIARKQYPLGPVYGVLVLALVFAGVAVGALIAGAMIANGLRLPRARKAPTPSDQAATNANADVIVSQPRAVRIAAAAAALDRRDIQMMASDGASTDRRTSVTTVIDRGAAPTFAAEPRLGQAPRRNASPRRIRAGGRSAR